MCPPEMLDRCSSFATARPVMRSLATLKRHFLKSDERAADTSTRRSHCHLGRRPDCPVTPARWQYLWSPMLMSSVVLGTESVIPALILCPSASCGALSLRGRPLRTLEGGSRPGTKGTRKTELALWPCPETAQTFEVGYWIWGRLCCRWVWCWFCRCPSTPDRRH